MTASSDDVLMDDNCVVEDHVISQCPQGSSNGNHGDSSTSNVPLLVFTPAKEIINEGL